ncbi:hypothetical protein [Runella sp.]|uniref:hypothetical protein n=1 Tax=Runella sp. TaxID=1960881 RepID=UPI00261895E8|nr:hypothetical protein [Runella sp.]
MEKKDAAYWKECYEGNLKVLIASRIDLDNYRDLVSRLKVQVESLSLHANKLEKRCEAWEEFRERTEKVIEENILENLKFGYNDSFQN